jgi:hypothetical protein
LRAHAIGHSLFPPTTLARALQRLVFVQADPIRSPARAQDLILRHRVKEYRAGTLERRYAQLALEEDALYAYGFLWRPVWQLLHPRRTSSVSAFQRRVLVAVSRTGPMHPRALDEEFGRHRVVNDWGGYSTATTHALDRLHRRGLVRVVRRENGVRVYEATAQPTTRLSADDRVGRLVVTVADILAPVDLRTLGAVSARLRTSVGARAPHQAVMRALLASGELSQRTLDGATYVWPATTSPDGAPPRTVRFLAPFDPLVWDRRRFEHLWRWPYRFEAYTPRVRRRRGYYAMPLLWGDDVIGWANAAVDGGTLRVECGFVGTRPAGREFSRELDAEIARLEAFLG